MSRKKPSMRTSQYDMVHSPFERMMREVPKAQPPEPVPQKAAPKGHPCYGCGQYGAICVRPCYRDREKHTNDKKGE